MDISFLAMPEPNHLMLITKTLQTHPKATTIQLWELNLHKIWQLEASQDSKARMAAERIAPASGMTSKAI